METESCRIMKNLMELENAKFRMNSRKSPTETRDDYVGLQSMLYPNLETRTKSKRLEDLERGWNNAFTKGEQSPPAEEVPRKIPDLSSTPSTSSSSSSEEGMPMSRWTAAVSGSSSSSASSSQDGKQMRRWTDHWKSLKDNDGNWRGKSSDKIESQTQKAMNAKILEAGWVSTFKSDQTKFR